MSGSVQFREFQFLVKRRKQYVFGLSTLHCSRLYSISSTAPTIVGEIIGNGLFGEAILVHVYTYGDYKRYVTFAGQRREWQHCERVTLDKDLMVRYTCLSVFLNSQMKYDYATRTANRSVEKILAKKYNNNASSRKQRM